MYQYLKKSIHIPSLLEKNYAKTAAKIILFETFQNVAANSFLFLKSLVNSLNLTRISMVSSCCIFIEILCTKFPCSCSFRQFFKFLFDLFCLVEFEYIRNFVTLSQGKVNLLFTIANPIIETKGKYT